MLCSISPTSLTWIPHSVLTFDLDTPLSFDFWHLCQRSLKKLCYGVSEGYFIPPQLVESGFLKSSSAKKYQNRGRAPGLALSALHLKETLKEKQTSS
jgi:hypothetical protein